MNCVVVECRRHRIFERASPGIKGGEGGEKNSHNHLLATQQGVADELASSQGNGGVVVRHGCDVLSGEVLSAG